MIEQTMERGREMDRKKKSFFSRHAKQRVAFGFFWASALMTIMVPSH